MQRLFVGILLLFIGLGTASAQSGGLPPLEKITAENVDQLTEVATLGYGRIYDVQWSPDGETIGIASEYTGSHLYRYGQQDSSPLQLVGGTIRNINFSPNGRWVISRSSTASQRRRVCRIPLASKSMVSARSMPLTPDSSRPNNASASRL